MMLQKALKMDHGEAYFDVLNDLKFYENEQFNQGDKPYTTTYKHFSNIASQMPFPPGNWKNDSVLTVVLQPAKHPGLNSVGAMGHGLGFLQPALLQTINAAVGGPGQFSQSTPKLVPPMLPPPANMIKMPAANPLKDDVPKLTSSGPTNQAKDSSRTPTADDGLRLLLSPWQQMMYVPPQQALVIDRMHSGARRFVVLDFGAPILLTDLIIPSCTDLVSLSIDIWLHREEVDGQRLVVASDIGRKSLVVCDLQPAPICRYLKVN